MNIDTYIARLKAVADNYTEYVYKELKESENYVLRIPRLRMSISGTDANDKKISPLYAESTKKRKQRKGQRTSNVTLKDSGDLRSSFYLVREGSAIDFRVGNFPYINDLVSHYSGNELFGFSPKDEAEIYRIFIKPALEKLISGDGIIDDIF